MADAANLEADIDLAARMFDALKTRTADGRGVTREAYGPGEAAAHDLVRETGLELDLEITHDFAGNTYATMPGRDRAGKRTLIGSHMDSVRRGGNFDGAAGVVAGLSALSALRRAGITPARDVAVMAIRGEESCWFPASYIGSRMALGTLPPEAVDTLRRADTGRTLAEHMEDNNFDPGSVRAGKRHLDPADISRYIEIHIEQGPVLASENIPLGIVEAIAGGLRFREGRIYGAYDHAGMAPRAYRHDAVAALGDFIVGINSIWSKFESEGHYCLFTFGIVGTDPSLHAFSRVPGEARFCLDTRAIHEAFLAEIGRRIADLIAGIEKKHGVRFEPGPDSGPPIARMDSAVRADLTAIAKESGAAFRTMPSGAGHDAAAFAAAGVPTAMLFIRNENGSHNPDEKMEMADFKVAGDLLARYLARHA